MAKKPWQFLFRHILNLGAFSPILHFPRHCDFDAGIPGCCTNRVILWPSRYYILMGTTVLLFYSLPLAIIKYLYQTPVLSLREFGNLVDSTLECQSRDIIPGPRLMKCVQRHSSFSLIYPSHSLRVVNWESCLVSVMMETPDVFVCFRTDTLSDFCKHRIDIRRKRLRHIDIKRSENAVSFRTVHRPGFKAVFSWIEVKIATK